MHILYGDTQWTTPGVLIPDIAWDDLVQLAVNYRQRVLPRHRKQWAGWVASCVLKDGATSRRKDDVDSMSDWIGLDFDHTNWTLRRLLKMFPSMACIAYSTTNSTATERRWRVLTPLSRACSVAEFAGVWRCFGMLSDGQVDARTKMPTDCITCQQNGSVATTMACARR